MLEVISYFPRQLRSAVLTALTWVRLHSALFLWQQAWFFLHQVLIWVLSYDGERAPEPLAITAAGAALALSGAPQCSAECP